MAGALRPGRESAVGAGATGAVATGAAVVIGGAVRAQAVAANATLPSPSCVTKLRREVARSSEDIASAGGGDAEWTVRLDASVRTTAYELTPFHRIPQHHVREEEFPIPNYRGDGCVWVASFSNPNRRDDVCACRGLSEYGLFSRKSPSHFLRVISRHGQNFVDFGRLPEWRNEPNTHSFDFVRSRWLPESTADSAGSTATTCTRGLYARSARAVPCIECAVLTI